MNLIRENTRYGLRALLHMVSHNCDRRFSAAELAEAADTTTDFMHKILQDLQGAGIVSSRSGPGGGSRLAREPDEVTLWDALQALQGSVAISKCMLGLDMCSWTDTCPLRSTWVKIQKQMEEDFSAVTLGDVIAGHTEQ